MGDPKENIEAHREEEARLESLAREWADKGRLLAFVFALAERADPLNAYRLLKAHGLPDDFAAKAPRTTADTLQNLLDEKGWDYKPNDEGPDAVIGIARDLASTLFNESHELPRVNSEVLDQAQANAEKIVSRWHNAADQVGARRYSPERPNN